MQERKPFLLEELKLEKGMEMLLDLGEVCRPLDIWLSVLEKKDLSAQPLIESFLLGHHLAQLERCLTEPHPSVEDFQAIMRVFKALCNAPEFLKVDEEATREFMRGIESIYFRHEAFRPQINALVNLPVIMDYSPHRVTLKLHDGELKTSALFLARIPVFFKQLTGPFLEGRTFESHQDGIDLFFGSGDTVHIKAVFYFLRYGHFPDEEIDALQMIILGDLLGGRGRTFLQPSCPGDTARVGREQCNGMVSHT